MSFARHCIENGIEGDDEQRPLTAEGKRKTKRAAVGLSRALDSLQTAGASPSRALQIRPLILTSPLLRARQTASILSKNVRKDWDSRQIKVAPDDRDAFA
jgi:phosphohistidine phosphatase SixA